MNFGPRFGLTTTKHLDVQDRRGNGLRAVIVAVVVSIAFAVLTFIDPLLSVVVGVPLLCVLVWRHRVFRDHE